MKYSICKAAVPCLQWWDTDLHDTPLARLNGCCRSGNILTEECDSTELMPSFSLPPRTGTILIIELEFLITERQLAVFWYLWINVALYSCPVCRGWPSNLWWSCWQWRRNRRPREPSMRRSTRRFLLFTQTLFFHGMQRVLKPLVCSYHGQWFSDQTQQFLPAVGRWRSFLKTLLTSIRDWVRLSRIKMIYVFL